MLAIATLARPVTTEEMPGLEPGIFSLFSRIVSTLATVRTDRNEARASQLIEENGGLISDDLERRIAVEYTRSPY